MSERTKGPKSYFPSIQSTCGKPMGHWMQQLKKVAGQKHLEQVTWPKNQHGLGHGHANALVHL